MENKLPAGFLELVSTVIPQSRIFADELRRFAYGTDASFYRLTPQLVIQVDSEQEIAELLILCAEQKVAVTFRGAGTSLSGQAVTDSVLVTLSPAWRKIRVLEDGKSIALQPGVIGARANLALASHGFKIGPDPASIQSATIGGIAANNASGMCCGVKFNAYHTLQSLRVVLADGTLLDTSDAKSVQSFRVSHAGLLAGLSALAGKTADDSGLNELISRKYAIKNTTGYSLNALVDYSDPVDILQHLMVGSEGTLGFLSEITLRTVPIKPFRAAGLVVFKDLSSCISASVRLSAFANIQALELMDDKSLLSVSKRNHFAGILPAASEGMTALLVEAAGETSLEVSECLEEVKKVLMNFPAADISKFSSEPEVMDQFWSVRKGLFPSVGAMRETSSTVVIEDVCVPLNFLDAAAHGIKRLFERLEYRDAVLFGHIRDGNLHIVFSQKFDSAAEIARYRKLMEGLTRLIVEEFSGSLKAEHGTGRNMAPFVEKEWGRAAYEMMREIKRLFDPVKILNPGVLLNRDGQVHLKNLKSFEAVDSVIDACIECGFCEPVCPSKDLSLTPRQRIAVAREIRREETKAPLGIRLKSLKRDFEYRAERTCAADGLCATACPVDIDTGAYIKAYRSVNHPAWKTQLAGFIADHFAAAVKMIGAGLYAAHFFSTIFGEVFIESVTKFINKLSGGKIPVWYSECPLPSGPLTAFSGNQNFDASAAEKMGYFPSCVSRTMGRLRKEPNKSPLPQAVIAVFRLLGIHPIIPEKTEGLCCGLVFSSKGFPRLGEEMRAKVLKAMSKQGAEQMLCDVSPCAQWLKEGSRGSGIRVLDSVEVLNSALTRGNFRVHPVDSAFIHTVCSIKKMQLEVPLNDLAKKLVRQPLFPYTGCCGFSGDKGLFTPELSLSAMGELKAGMTDKSPRAYTTSPTCGIAVSKATGVLHQSLFHLFLECVKK